MTRVSDASDGAPRNHTLVRPQPFDSEALGAPVAKLVVPDGPAGAEIVLSLPELVHDWQRSGLWLVSCRIDVGRSAAEAIHRDLLAVGFRHIETLVTLSRPTAGAVAGCVEPLSMTTVADIPACVRIARAAFKQSRFHLDPLVDDARACDLKAKWTRNSIEGRADASLVVRRNGPAIGFVFCLRGDPAATIDLIAVDPDNQREGIGRSLVAGVLDHYRDQVDRVTVGTQAENPASLSFYRDLGFTELSRARTYHWINPSAAPGGMAGRGDG